MTDQPTVSEMLRTTIANATEFLVQIANHLDVLEAENIELKARLAELEKEIDNVQK